MSDKEHIIDPTPEALKIADDVLCHAPGEWLKERIARALDTFAQARVEAAVEKERERCAEHAKAARSEAAIERHKTDDPEGKACWLWAFDTANNIERAIRSGDQP